MDNYILKLIPDGRESQELVLHPHRLESSILDAVRSTSAYVFCDFKYSGELICDHKEKITNLQMSINGNPVNVVFHPDTGSILFNDFSFGQRIFTECYGFVQIAISFDTPAEPFFLETEYVQVMVRKGKQNDSVRRMVEFVYNHNERLLYGNKLQSKDAVNLEKNLNRTIESQILLLKQISVSFEEQYSYFRINSRFITIPHEHVDSFEKLQYISNRSIQYMVQHPEELQRISGSSGIKIGNNRYQPNKTLITNAVRSFDIYENRCIVGFLKKIIGEIDDIEEKLKNAIAGVPNAPRETDDYVTSSYFIYANTTETLKVILDDVRQLHQKYYDLYSAYSNVLQVKDVIVNSIPKPTHIFMSLPQYRHIYECMVSWFTMGAFTLNAEKFMLSFLRVSALYEVYALSKFIEYFEDSEYRLIVADKKTYTFTGNVLYQNTNCNNFFVFEKGNSRITLYYQPVIYNIDKRTITGIGLYRNTSISFPKYLDDSSTGYYYSPDYLIKYESDSDKGTRYLIADAKFSTVKNVKERQVVPLAYKYLFSISPFDSEDAVVGLCIINGQSDGTNDKITEIYDFSHNPREIFPRATILTLTENSENNKNLHASLLKSVLES